MKLLIYILFTIGVVFLTIGYMNSTTKCPPRKIEYRYIPKKEYEEQMDEKHIDNIKHIFD